MILQYSVNAIAYAIVGCAIEVHKHLGPGLLESVYQSCLVEELKASRLHVSCDNYVPIKYKEKDLGGILKLDLLVENLVIVELKAVDVMHPIYKAQLISYFNYRKTQRIINKLSCRKNYGSISFSSYRIFFIASCSIT
jgi:GxxExxY protein